MSKQHTPGPWVVGRRDYRGPGVVQVVDHDGGVATIAEVTNARDSALISAAPDLLAACERMVHAYDDEDEECITQAIRKMRAAVAKASGR